MQLLAFGRLSRTLIVAGSLLVAVGLILAFVKAHRNGITQSFTLWVCGIGTIVFFVLAAWVGHREPGIRVIGMIFQLAALAVALYGLNDIRTRLNQPGLITALVRAAEGPFVVNHPPIVGIGSVTEAHDISEGYATLTTHPTSLSTEARFEVLENQVAKLEGVHAADTAALRRSIGDNERLATGRYRQLEAAVEAVRSLVVDLRTGGFVLAFFGIVWLMIGTVLTSIPDWVAGLISKVSH